jgi:hypothetical protein
MGIETVKKLGLLVALLLLAPIITGCGYYTVQNSTQTNCTPGVDCGNSYYQDDGYGNTYHCDSSGCDTSNPVTPPAASPAACSCFAPPASIQSDTSVQSSVSTQCVPNYIYDKLVDKGQAFSVVSPQENINGSTSPTPDTFTATTSKTVTVTDQNNVISSLTASAQIPLLASITSAVRTQINHSVAQAVTTSIGNSTNLTVPPGQTGYADYGVIVQVVNGHLYDQSNCEASNSDFGMDITYVPVASGWCSWVSSQSPPCAFLP